MRTLIYLEDEQCYYTTIHVFETDCDWPIEALEKLSWEPARAGRISTSFETFAKLLEGRGFICNPSESRKVTGVVKGAYGNY